MISGLDTPRRRLHACCWLLSIGGLIAVAASWGPTDMPMKPYGHYGIVILGIGAVGIAIIWLKIAMRWLNRRGR